MTIGRNAAASAVFAMEGEIGALAARRCSDTDEEPRLPPDKDVVMVRFWAYSALQKGPWE